MWALIKGLTSANLILTNNVCNETVPEVFTAQIFELLYCNHVKGKFAQLHPTDGFPLPSIVTTVPDTRLRWIVAVPAIVGLPLFPALCTKDLCKTCHANYKQGEIPLYRKRQSGPFQFGADETLLKFKIIRFEQRPNKSRNFQTPIVVPFSVSLLSTTN